MWHRNKADLLEGGGVVTMELKRPAIPHIEHNF